MGNAKIRAKRVQPKKWWTRCIGPKVLSDPGHGYYQHDVAKKVGMCRLCLDQIQAMHLSPKFENPLSGESE